MQVKKVSYREVMLSHFTQLKSSRAEGLNLDNLAPVNKFSHYTTVYFRIKNSILMGIIL